MDLFIMIQSILVIPTGLVGGRVSRISSVRKIQIKMLSHLLKRHQMQLWNQLTQREPQREPQRPPQRPPQAAQIQLQLFPMIPCIRCIRLCSKDQFRPYHLRHLLNLGPSCGGHLRQCLQDQDRRSDRGRLLLSLVQLNFRRCSEGTLNLKKSRKCFSSR